jgi:uncharacterized protein
MEIILLSDTHLTDRNSLPEELVKHLHDASLVLHAGDLVSLDVLQALQAHAVTVAVHGNKDERAVIDRLPANLTVSIAGKSIGLIHGHRAKKIEQFYREPELNYDSPKVTVFYDYLLSELPDADIIGFGHFHEAVVYQYQERLLVNPGTAAPDHPNRSIAIFETAGDGLSVRIESF